MIPCVMTRNPKITALGARIKKLRDERGWSQSDLAAEAKLAPTTIHKIEVGKTEAPRIDALMSIAAALGVSVAELIESSDGKITELYGADWKERAIREVAPHTPLDQARRMLALIDALPPSQWAAATAMLQGLAGISVQRESNSRIAEAKKDHELEEDGQRAK